MTRITRLIAPVSLTLKGMGVGAAAPVASVAATFGLLVALLAMGASEDLAHSIFWQMGYFPTSFFGCWWIFLFARTQLDAGGELIFVYERHPLVKFGALYSLLYTAILLAAAALASIAIPAKAGLLLVAGVEFAIRGSFYASLFLAILSLTRSSAAGLLVSFSYAALSYFALAGVVPETLSIFPARLPTSVGDAFALHMGAVTYTLIGLAITYRAERGYFG